MKGKYSFEGKTVIRTDQGIFIPGQSYTDLPNNDYIKSLIAQGYFKKLNPKAKPQ